MTTFGSVAGSVSGTVEWLVVAVAGVVGLFIGSFLNVVVYRAPLGLSVSTPRSFCPTCDRQLEWWENVPLVSWLGLRGRCHTCHTAISPRYPLVEAGTAVSFVLITWAWHGSALSAGYCVLAATAISVALIEYGGARSPLSVAAIGAGVGQVLIVGAAVWLDRLAVLGWSLVGLLAGTILFGALRARDPDCRDPRWHGRSLLPVAGCWLGGLAGTGVRPLIAGLAAWVVAEAVCLVVVWGRIRGVARTGARAGPGSGADIPVAMVPLATGVLAALVVSLTVAG